MSRLLKAMLFGVFVVVAAAGFSVTSMVRLKQAEDDAAATARKPEPRRVFCSGLVEAIDGEIDVMAQLSGELSEVSFREGDQVEQGDVLAVIDARREAAAVATAEANLALAKAKLARVEAGAGNEEVMAAYFGIWSADAQMAALQERVDQLVKHEGTSNPSTELKEADFHLQAAKRRHEGAVKNYEALKRGPLDEDLAAAKAGVDLAEKGLAEAKTDYSYHRIVAPTSGTVLALHRHRGDLVSAAGATPIVRLADTDRLRIRLEIDEAEIDNLKVGMKGDFTLRGKSEATGRLVIKRVIPLFGPKRLFNPDTSARVDTRTLDVLCEVLDDDAELIPGQRITAEFELKKDNKSDDDEDDDEDDEDDEDDDVELAAR